MEYPDCNPIEWQRVRDNGEISVLLIRHGQTEWNKQRRFLGRTDIPLDATGRQQAALLAHSLAHIPFSAIYSSPLSRAWGTAEAMATPRAMEPIVAEGLTELDQGHLEGRFGSNLKADFPDFYRQWTEDPTHARIPGGETLAECSRRSIEAFMSIVREQTPDKPCAIVSHKVAISAIICQALDLAIRDNMTIEQRNTTINLLGIKDGKITVYGLNNARHLTETLPIERP